MRALRPTVSISDFLRRNRAASDDQRLPPGADDPE